MTYFHPCAVKKDRWRGFDCRGRGLVYLYAELTVEGGTCDAKENLRY